MPRVMSRWAPTLAFPMVGLSFAAVIAANARTTIARPSRSTLPAVMRKIQRINAAVNKSVAPVSDMDHWGVVDQWDYPTDGKGDCEDYALLKRRMLMDEGFPRQALLMTVVKEANGDGHAVLTVKTNRGEFVLDNLGDEVKAEQDALSLRQAAIGAKPQCVGVDRRPHRRAGLCLQIKFEHPLAKLAARRAPPFFRFAARFEPRQRGRRPARRSRPLAPRSGDIRFAQPAVDRAGEVNLGADYGLLSGFPHVVFFRGAKRMPRAHALETV